uniref:hypothetical protein n=1 Tax=Alistipes sp. TaxID=1872444 RepID=UPI004057CBB6
MRKFPLLLVALVLSVSMSLSAQEQQSLYHRGNGSFVYTEYAPFKEKPITVYYYIPSHGDIKSMRVLFSMHDANRRGKTARAMWRNFAERDGFIVLAPEYSKKIYRGLGPYQHGNVMRGNKVRPQEEWVYSTIEAIFDHFKKHTGSTAEVYDMHGHSAGGQFTHRFVMAMPNARLNIAVASNPGSVALPLVDGLRNKETDKVYNWPFSVKSSPMATNEYLEKAFARRLYVHIGKLDTANSGGGISKLQGEHRLARGRNFYKTAKRVARKNHWDFNWEKVEVKNVGHSGWGMVYGLKHNKISEYSEDEYLKTSAYYLIYKKGANSKK